MPKTTTEDFGDIGAIVAHNIKFDIKNPATGNPIGLRIELRPFTDPKIRSVQRKITDKRLKLAARRKDFNAEQLEQASYDQLIAAIVNWEWLGNANFKGEKLSFTDANARMLFDALPFIPAQIDEKLAEDEAFF